MARVARERRRKKDEKQVTTQQPLDAEARRMRLKTLIVLGKERGYLTYAEINDHLPDDMLDAEQIENIISMINDMGIQVYDEAPDSESLLMTEPSAPVADEDAAEEAEQALSTADSEFGRTTDPVRMYMREMGSVELLTREGEIEIAKRIEDGLKHMVQAISACPMTIAEILELADKIEREEMRVDEVVDGLIDPNAPEEEEEEASSQQIESDLSDNSDDDNNDDDDDEEEEEEPSEEQQAAIQRANLLQLKTDALERFARIRSLNSKMLKALARGGTTSRSYIKAQQEISDELMLIRFGAKQIEFLCDSVRQVVDEVRTYEREIMDLA
ncbi:MAG: RNA polymerase sigma factor region1.1 domain-containing protein, partial [Burkholderiales bacterium]